MSLPEQCHRKLPKQDPPQTKLIILQEVSKRGISFWINPPAFILKGLLNKFF